MNSAAYTRKPLRGFKIKFQECEPPLSIETGKFKRFETLQNNKNIMSLRIGSYCETLRWKLARQNKNIVLFRTMKSCHYSHFEYGISLLILYDSCNVCLVRFVRYPKRFISKESFAITFLVIIFP